MDPTCGSSRRLNEDSKMSPITSQIEIACPAEDVFAYVTDALRFSEWQDDVVSARFQAGGSSGVGSRFTTVRRMGRTQRAITQEVTKDQPPTVVLPLGLRVTP